MIRPSRYFKCCAPMLLGFALTGCSSLLRSQAPPVQTYTLTAADVTQLQSSAAAAPAGVSLRVAHPLAGPGLGTAQIVLRQSDHRLNVYAASAWAADVPALVESLAVETLRQSHHWHSVENAESPFPPDELLQITIRRFDADYSAGEDAPPTVHVEFDCTLRKADSRTVLASFVATGSAVARANRLGAVVQAFQQATDEALASLTRQTFGAMR